MYGLKGQINFNPEGLLRCGRIAMTNGTEQQDSISLTCIREKDKLQTRPGGSEVLDGSAYLPNITPILPQSMGFLHLLYNRYPSMKSFSSCLFGKQSAGYCSACPLLC